MDKTLWWIILNLLMYITHLTVSVQNSRSARLGDRANIVWNINARTDGYESFIIYYNTTENTNRLFSRAGKISSSGSFSPNILSGREIIHRSFARYFYIGRTGGLHTGKVTLTIRSLKIDDGGVYILSNLVGETVRTELKVTYGPEKCGTALKERYRIVRKGELLRLKAIFCGRPPPSLKCVFDGGVYNSFYRRQISQNNYSYALDIVTNLQKCDQKQLKCYVIVNGYGFIERAVVSRDYSTSGERIFTKNLVFSRSCGKCLVSWETNIDVGYCKVCYALQFLNGTHITTIHGCFNETKYDCSEQPDEYGRVSITTYVQGLNGLTGHTSSATGRVDIPCTTKMPTVTTVTEAIVPATNTKYAAKLHLQKQIEQLDSKFSTNLTISAIIIAVMFIIALILVIMAKVGRINFEILGRTNQKINIKNPVITTDDEQTSEAAPLSDYMELHPARKDAIYEGLTSI